MAGPSAIVFALLGLPGAAGPAPPGAPGRRRSASQRTLFKDSVLRCAARRPCPTSMELRPSAASQLGWWREQLPLHPAKGASSHTHLCQWPKLNQCLPLHEAQGLGEGRQGDFRQCFKL